MEANPLNEENMAIAFDKPIWFQYMNMVTTLNAAKTLSVKLN